MLPTPSLPSPLSLGLATLLLLPLLAPSPGSPSALVLADPHFHNGNGGGGRGGHDVRCRDGAYYSFRRHSCQPCGPHVLTCSGPDQASSCERGFDLVRGECVFHRRRGDRDRDGPCHRDWARAESVPSEGGEADEDGFEDDDEFAGDGGLAARDLTGGLVGGLLSTDGDQDVEDGEDVGQGQGGLISLGVGSVEVSDLLDLRKRGNLDGADASGAAGAGSSSGNGVRGGGSVGGGDGRGNGGGFSSSSSSSSSSSLTGDRNNGRGDGSSSSPTGDRVPGDGSSSSSGLGDRVPGGGDSNGRGNGNGSNNGNGLGGPSNNPNFPNGGANGGSNGNGLGPNNGNGVSPSPSNSNGLDFGSFDGDTDFGGTNGRFCARAIAIACTDVVRIRHGRTRTAFLPCATKVIRRGRDRGRRGGFGDGS